MNDDRRVYLEYVPTSAGRQSLMDLQALINTTVPGLLVPSSELHLTLIHIGKIQAVIADLRRYQPTVKTAIFLKALHSFTQTAGRLMPKQTRLFPYGIDLYGTRQSVIALECRPSRQLVRAHAECLTLTKATLQACLRRDPLDFMRQSPNFRNSLEFKPHISLIKSSRQMLPAKPVALPTSLLLKALPLEHDLKAD